MCSPTGRCRQRALRDTGRNWTLRRADAGHRREMNLSETTFVLRRRSSAAYWMRIFTPAQEIPFAGIRASAPPTSWPGPAVPAPGAGDAHLPAVGSHAAAGYRSVRRKAGPRDHDAGRPTFGGVVRDLTPVAEALAWSLVPWPGRTSPFRSSPPAWDTLWCRWPIWTPRHTPAECRPTGRTPSGLRRAGVFCVLPSGDRAGHLRPRPHVAPGAGVRRPRHRLRRGPLGAYLAVHGVLPRPRRSSCWNKASKWTGQAGSGSR